MKTTILKSVLFLALAAGTFSSCVNDDDYEIPTSECVDTTLEATIPVAAVPAGTLAQYLQDDIIEAYVTSSDEGGNFFKTISFQTKDGAKGFSVPVDASSTFISFTPGRKVFVKLKNLYTDLNNGGTRIGAVFISTSGVASVGRLPESQYKDVLVASCEIINENELVRTMTIAEAKQDKNINTLIELDGVQFADAAISKTYYDPNNVIGGATNHMLTDLDGNTVIFRTSSFANFAGRPVPDGSGKVRGVMTKFGSDYQFMARTERDVKLDQPRVSPFFSEDFQTAIDNTVLNIPNWTNVTTAGTKLWREEVFSGNGYAELSSFNSGNASNVSWLITPGIDMDSHTGEVLTFRTAQHHLDVDSPANSLEVLVSTDFTGNVATATWTQVEVNLPTMATPWYEFVSSGGVDLSGYTGTLHVAFKFIGSGTDLTLDGAFQIDDVRVLGN
jgi:hypothetical protein